LNNRHQAMPEPQNGMPSSAAPVLGIAALLDRAPTCPVFGESVGSTPAL